jgi:tyrosinase
MTDISTATRYDRVRLILDNAAGESKADYGGAGRFWNDPLPKLLALEIYGVRMIAPEEKETCACCEGRGAKSGLVRGLRGRAPFDGTRFPRLPWGGRAVAPDDIEFISQWIDDGCPADDRETTYAVSGTATEPELEEVPPEAVEAEVQAFEVYDGSPNEYRYKYGELKQRVNLDCMSPSQLENFRGAFRELYRLNKWPEDIRSYNNVALIHQNHCQHGWERFLPWHRVYLYEMEQTIQDLCPGVTMPYWDWTMQQYMPDNPAKGWIIPQSYKAFLTDASLRFLQDAIPPLPAEAAQTLKKDMVNKGLLYTSPTTFFAAVAEMIGAEYTQGDHRDRFIDALLAANSLWYPLRFPSEYYSSSGVPEPITVAIQYHYPTADDIEQILSLRTFRDFGGGSLYNDSFGFLDQNPHNTMHIWTGGQNPNPAPNAEDEDSTDFDVMNRNRTVKVAGRTFHSRNDMYSQPGHGDMFSNLTASFDPVFWPIHVNVDRLWHEWQQRHPNSPPDDLDAVLTPWSYTIADTLDMAQFGYEYVKCSFIVPVGLSAPVSRFVSKPIEIPAPARKSFRQAEVRLHRVPQLPRSCFIRVFLNNPDANASTPLDDPSYAGYLAVFGHGGCIGGPGHCDLPPARARQYDIRPRSHNTPRNHRVIVTKAAKAALKKSSSLQITLVVIGADYREERDLLRVDGVSLDFLD